MTRVALVTGASRGIGRAIALRLARDGAAVACAYREDDASAEKSVAEIHEHGGEATAIRADIADEENVERMFREIQGWAGPPAILVNNAGIVRDGLSARYATEDLDRTFEVNLRGAFLCARSAMAGMLRARWGRIVNVSSAAALAGNPGQAAYAASKAGLLGMSRSMAREIGGRGITVNAICPGVVETDMTAEMAEEARAALVARCPAGRAGTVDEIAAAVGFLVSVEASYVNGAILTVDGGLTA